MSVWEYGGVLRFIFPNLRITCYSDYLPILVYAVDARAPHCFRFPPFP